MNIHEPSPEFLTSQKLNIGAFPLTVLLLHGVAATVLVESNAADQNIEIWDRAIHGCLSIVSAAVSEVSQDNPLPLLAPIMCAVAQYMCVCEQSRAQNSIVCSNSIMCTKQFVICTPHTLSRAFFVLRDSVALEHCNAL